MLGSATNEEAPISIGAWMTQRTRWIKGWMQTYLVHTRAPLRSSRELGGRQTLALHVLMGGILLSVLAAPIILGLAWLSFDGGRGARGLTGRLARENAARNPRRTASASGTAWSR